MNLSPETIYAIVATVATLGLTAIHNRGFNVPIISGILSLLAGKTPAPPAPAPDVPPTVPTPPPTVPNHPILNLILSAVLQALGTKTVSGFNVETAADKVTVNLNTK